MKRIRLWLSPCFLFFVLLLAAGVASAGTIQFVATNVVAQEKKGSVLLTVARTLPGTNVVTVHYATSDGTATAGEDYVAKEGTLTFSNKAAKATLLIPILNDSLSESNETFSITLSDVAGGDTLGAKSSAMVTIQSDDKAGTVQFSSARYTVNEGTPSIAITVTRKGGTASGVSVDYATQGGTAVAGNHYGGASGTVRFGSNVLSQTFSVPILANQMVDGDRTVVLKLSNPLGGATLGPIKEAVLTIVDAESSLQFSQATYSASETTPSVLITVTRTGPITGSNSVQWATSDVTAMHDSDYTTVSGLLTFPPGMKLRTFTIPILADSTMENTESFQVALSNPTGGALLGTPSVSTVNIADKPDPNAVPASGPPFFNITITGANIAFNRTLNITTWGTVPGLTSTLFTNSANGNIITMVANKAVITPSPFHQILDNCTFNVFQILGVGSRPLGTPPGGTIVYTFQDVTSAGGTVYGFEWESGLVRIDGLSTDGSGKITALSGRLDIIAKNKATSSSTERVHIVGSFRTKP